MTLIQSGSPSAAIGKADAVGPESVGEDDLGAGLDIGARHRLHLLGMGEVSQIGRLARLKVARLKPKEILLEYSNIILYQSVLEEFLSYISEDELLCVFAV